MAGKGLAEPERCQQTPSAQLGYKLGMKEDSKKAVIGAVGYG